jgi:alpha-ketoglutarate-dependent taurine dioxygenase
MATLQITPLHPPLGAEVAGVDLSQPIGASTRITKATHIGGMTPDASKAYMGDLIGRMIRPEIVYHHVWRKGDVLVIDDRATMHRAHGDYDRSQSRTLWRIIVEGDRPRLV